MTVKITDGRVNLNPELTELPDFHQSSVPPKTLIWAKEYSKAPSEAVVKSEVQRILHFYPRTEEVFILPYTRSQGFIRLELWFHGALSK